MPQLIVSRSGNKAFSLGNSYMARFMDVGESWTRIRIGLTLRISGAAFGNITGTPRLAIGLCSGVTNPFGATLTDNFVGVITNQATFAAKTDLYGNTGNTSGMGMFPATKVGATLTIGGSNCFTSSIAALHTLQSGIILDIRKGSSNFTLVGIGTNDTGSNDGINQDTVKTGTEGSIMDPFLSTGGNTYYLGPERTIAVDESTNGFLNAVNIFWDQSDPTLEVSNIWYSRMS
tara:strand:+ start:123828 stop:124523 length:696 start_codon:yes stop_codon:yes gene_type:complete